MLIRRDIRHEAEDAALVRAGEDKSRGAGERRSRGELSIFCYLPSTICYLLIGAERRVSRRRLGDGLLFGPGLGFGGVEDEVLEGHEFAGAADSGAQTVTPVEGDGLMPIVEALRLGSSDEEFGEGVGAGDGKL